jgi:glycerophosphoryl diester phosphodiesterase
MRKDGDVGSLRRPPSGGPIGFAHRGARAECRDNTLASFARALELGARGLESDAWTTRDGVVVLDHDGVVRHGVRRIAIRDLRRDELPAHIPTLAELLALSDADIDLSLDIKDPAAAELTIARVEEAGRAARTWLCGRGDDLVRWRQRSEQIRLVDSTRLARITEGLAARVEQLAATGIDALNLRWPEWDQARLHLVHAAGLLGFAWDTQRAATMATMARLGVDGLYSDHVARMVATLRPRADPAARPQ